MSRACRSKSRVLYSVFDLARYVNQIKRRKKEETTENNNTKQPGLISKTA